MGKYIPFMAKCIKSSGTFFTIDRVYYIVDGTVRGDNGAVISEHIANIDELNLLFSSQFELVEF